jgi:cell wall-associated NlpC family hydrolase
LSLRIAAVIAISAALTGVTPAVAAAESGGAGLGTTSPTPAPAPTKAKHGYYAPTTVRNFYRYYPRYRSYRGRVFVRTETGQVVPYSTTSSATLGSGGSAFRATNLGGLPHLLVPGRTSRYIHGLAAAPERAPLAVQQMIWAGNELIGKPYIWGGGHASFTAPGYDCSGTVSYALHSAGLLSSPEVSGSLESYGGGGVGHWVTIFANGGHVYMTIAGIRLDTSPAYDPTNLQGPRWRPLMPSNSGFVVRHPNGL